MQLDDSLATRSQYAVQILRAAGFGAPHFKTAWIAGATLNVYCQSEEAAVVIRDQCDRLSRLAEIIPSPYPSDPKLGTIRLEFDREDPDVEADMECISHTLKPPRTVKGVLKMAIRCSQENRIKFSRILRMEERDRHLIGEILERPGVVYLTDMETDVARIGTADIMSLEERIALDEPRLAVENSVKLFWQPYKLEMYKQELLRSLTPDMPSSMIDITWEAKGMLASGLVTPYELRNRGQVSLVTYQGRTHRLVEVLESVPILEEA